MRELVKDQWQRTEDEVVKGELARILGHYPETFTDIGVHVAFTDGVSTHPDFETCEPELRILVQATDPNLIWDAVYFEFQPSQVPLLTTHLHETGRLAEVRKANLDHIDDVVAEYMAEKHELKLKIEALFDATEGARVDSR